MKDGTRAAAHLLGRMIAEDVEPARTRLLGTEGTDEDRLYVYIVDALLRQLERLDVGVSEGQDREREALQYGAGEVWLQIAESDRMPHDYLNHVLAHLVGAGAVGPPHVRSLLQSIGHMDAETMDSASLGFPEYVGLMRAFRDVPDAVLRMRAVVGR